MHPFPDPTPDRFRISVVIPSYQRRELVINLVKSLMHQRFDEPYEVVVAVDGSTDGTAEALRALTVPFPLTVIEQPNQGGSAARNNGAAAAGGAIILFLDDDMEAHPDLLRQHAEQYDRNADMVLGHIPLHPTSPTNVLSAGVQFWADTRTARLSMPGASLTVHDLITGQMSVWRRLFYELGGFDTRFTSGGTWGNEDIDFGHRFVAKGHTIVFNPEAISWQYYAITPRQYLRQWYQAGQADVVFARKHPDQLPALYQANRATKPTNRYLWRPLATLPSLAAPVATVFRWLAISLANTGWRNQVINTLFYEARRMEYWRGVESRGGLAHPGVVRVLAYHAIADLAGKPIFEPYGVPPQLFYQSLQLLKLLGFQFIDGDTLLGFLTGQGRLPRNAVLLTFDDGYAELVDVVLPMLKELSIPAIVFAVSKRLGATNIWDAALGAPQLRLMDADGLRALAKHGIEIGAHTRTHPVLPRLAAQKAAEEIGGSIDDLEALGLPKPRFFAYPYGEWNEAAKQVLREVGAQAAFTVDAGFAQPLHNPYQLPRIEILRADTGWRLVWKVVTADKHQPFSLLRHQVHSLIRRITAYTKRI